MKLARGYIKEIKMMIRQVSLKIKRLCLYDKEYYSLKLISPWKVQTIRQFSTSFKTIKVHEENGVREIQLNNPKARNSLGLDTMDELMDAITHEQDNKSLRCIVISSTGLVFSSGHNLKELVRNWESKSSTNHILNKLPSRPKRKAPSSTNKSFIAALN